MYVPLFVNCYKFIFKRQTIRKVSFPGRERKLPDCSKGQHRKHRKPIVMDDLETTSENTSDLASYSDDEKKDDATYDFR